MLAGEQVVDGRREEVREKEGNNVRAVRRRESAGRIFGVLCFELKVDGFGVCMSRVELQILGKVEIWRP